MDLKPQLPISKVDYKVIGDSGTERYSGYFTEEPQNDWRDESRVTNVETMRRTDGTVKQLLNALKAPILATKYSIEPADSDPKSIEQADFVRNNLFNMRRTWKEFMREALTYFDFGHSVFELIWTKKNGKIWLADLEPRIQHSILKWQLDDGRRGIVQLIKTDENDNNNKQAQIPLNKLLVFTNDKEGDDMTGQSVLRPSWKHFYIKDTLYRISSISCERYGVGIPTITMPDGAGDTEKDLAKELGKNLRSHEEGYIVKPSKDWNIEILTPSGNPQQGQIESLIQHHDRMILMSALAGFLNLGADSKGSYALSRDQSGFFLKHVEDKLMYIVEQIMKQVMQRMVIVNYGMQEKYPKLTFTPLGEIDFAEYSTTLKTLVDAGLLRPDAETQQFARKTFKLPELTDEEMFELKQEEIDAKIAEIEANTDSGDIETDIPPEEEPEDQDTDLEVPEDTEEDDLEVETEDEEV